MAWEEKFVQDLLREFPGLKTGDPVEGEELKVWIFEYFERIQKYLRRKKNETDTRDQ